MQTLQSFRRWFRSARHKRSRHEENLLEFAGLFIFDFAVWILVMFTAMCMFGLLIRLVVAISTALGLK